MPKFPSQIEYSETYSDDQYFYRNVRLTKEVFKRIKQGGKILTEEQWKELGIQRSRGWQHYCIYKPELQIIMLRKPLK